jgi:type IV secretory pathway VirB10-like protein
LAKEKSPQKEQIKVTDKRIFTPEGDIREEFRQQIKPADPSLARPEPPPPPPQEKSIPKPPQEERRARAEGPPPGGERRRTLADKAQNPGTAFADFVEPLIAQAYMSMGMLRNPYQAKPTVDVSAARQMIEILTMLKEKTAGNLTPDEEDFLTTHLGELKLAFVQRTKSL